MGDTLYIKNGEILPRYRIRLGQRLCPSHDALVNDGWKLYEPSEEDILNRAKSIKIAELSAYDKSNEVNLFFISDFPVWLDKETRVGLKLRFEAELAQGKDETILWHEGIQFPLPLSSAMQMLYALELYASECYDNTARHRANINALTTIEEVEAYDFTLFYPEKLRF
jgi:hypothetical protein